MEGEVTGGGAPLTCIEVHKMASKNRNIGHMQLVHTRNKS